MTFKIIGRSGGQKIEGKKIKKKKKRRGNLDIPYAHYFYVLFSSLMISPKLQLNLTD